MCIIIQGNPNDITKKILKNAYQNNENGFGLMYLKNKNYAPKDSDWDDAIAEWKELYSDESATFDKVITMPDTRNLTIPSAFLLSDSCILSST